MPSFRLPVRLSKVLHTGLRRPFSVLVPSESALSETTSEGAQFQKINPLPAVTKPEKPPDVIRKRFRPNPGRMWNIRFGGAAMAEMQRGQQIKRGKCYGTELLTKHELAAEHCELLARNGGKQPLPSLAQAELLSKAGLTGVDSLVGLLPTERPQESSADLAQTAAARGLKLLGQGTGLGLPQTLSRTGNHHLAVTGEFRSSKTKQLTDQLTDAVKAAPSALPLDLVHSLAEISELRGKRRQLEKKCKDFKDAIELNSNTLALLEDTLAANQPRSESFMSDVSSSSSVARLDETAAVQPQQSRSESFMSDVSSSSTASAPEPPRRSHLSVINAIAQHKRKQTKLLASLAPVQKERESIQTEIAHQLQGRIHHLLTLDDKGRPLDSQMQQLLLQAHAQLAAAPCGAKEMPIDLALEMVTFALKMARSAQAATTPCVPKASPYIERDSLSLQQAHGARYIERDVLNPLQAHCASELPKPAAAHLFSDLRHVTKAGACVDLAAKIFSLPRGTEILERLVPDLIPPCIRDNHDLRDRYRMALRVKVSASDALCRLPAEDVASRAWLQRALKVAQHELDLGPAFEPKFTPADFAAFHGVRNGFTRIGPGTSHAYELARANKFQTWISRSNNRGLGRKRKSPFIAKSIRLAGTNMQNLGQLPTRTKAHAQALASARTLNRCLRKIVHKQGRDAPELEQVDAQAMALLDGLLTAVKIKAAAPRRRDLLRPHQDTPDATTLARRAASLRINAKLLDQVCAVAEARNPTLNLKTSALLMDLKKSPTNFAQALRTVLAQLTLPEPEAVPALDPLAGATNYQPRERPPPPARWRALLSDAQATVQTAVVSRLWEHKGELDGDDVADMLSEIIVKLQDRTKLRITQGGSLGGSTLPTTVALRELIRGLTTLGLKFDIKKTWASEAVVEVAQPLHATQLTIGVQKTKTTVARGAARIGAKFKVPGTHLEVNARADIADHKRTHETQEFDGFSMRAKRNNLDKERPQRIMADQARALCTWKKPTPEQAQNGECSNILDYLLSKYPDYTLSEIESNRKETHKREANLEGVVGPQWGDRVKLTMGGGVASGNQRWEHRIKEVDAGVLQVLETRSNVRVVRSVQVGAGLTGTSLNCALQGAGGPSLAVLQSLLRVDAEMEFNPREFEEISKFTTDQHTILPIQVQSNTESRNFPDFIERVNQQHWHWVRLRTAQHPGGVTSPYSWLYAPKNLHIWLGEREKLHGDDTAYITINGLYDSAASEVDIHHARIIGAKYFDDIPAVLAAQDAFLALMQTDIFETRRLIPKIKIKAESKLATPFSVASGQTIVETQSTPTTFPTWG
jgi:hypothetical protein